MANQEHLDILKQGVEAWNQWRKEHTDVEVDLSFANLGRANLRDANLRDANFTGAILREAFLEGAFLSFADLRRADLRDADLRGAELYGTDLSHAKLSGANLSEADLNRASLWGTDLSGANLREAFLGGAYLEEANLSGADLSKANLSGAVLVETDLSGATLTGCSIYGISVWKVQLEGAKQENLVITKYDEPTITVDNLKIAQFIYLLLNNVEIREVIDTITSKVVLILGRFTPERKAILDALREALRARNYLPIVFDFEIPGSRDITEAVSLLARMARFVIADLTDAKSVPQELSVIVPDLPSVPVQPLLQTTDKAYSMFEHWMRFSWVLQIYYYTSVDDLLPALKEHIIDPAEQKVQELKRPQ